MSVYFFGGSCIEDVTTHLMSHLSLHPYSADTILRAIKELTQDNISKWVRTSRQYVLNIYSCNNAYADVFQKSLDDTDNLWSWFCVLPQVAWWGKWILCVFVAIFAALHPLLPQCRYLFDLCVILWGRLRIWGYILIILVAFEILLKLCRFSNFFHSP